PQRRASTVARIGQWAGGAAVAASVAMVALIAVQPDAPQATDAVATAPAVQSTAPAAPQVASSPWRERDLRPNLAAQTASVARLADPDATPGPVVRAQPLYVPMYLVPQASRDVGYTLRRDSQGTGWVMVEPVKSRPEDQDPGH
ncbi:MAG TPA: hypothetical protein PKZ76_02375, partial [Xanthomonadaceae bacterium]|nr:hypothetical protein [Xanthomonadaceae bacterium]